MNHPYSQSRSSKGRNLHPTKGRNAAFWGTEHSTCQIIQSLLLVPEEIKNKYCQKALQQNESFVPGLQNWKQRNKVERQQIKVLSLVTALLITPGCWCPVLDVCPAASTAGTRVLPLNVASRESSSPSLLGVFPKCTLSLGSVQIPKPI